MKIPLFGIWCCHSSRTFSLLKMRTCYFALSESDYTLTWCHAMQPCIVRSDYALTRHHTKLPSIIRLSLHTDIALHCFPQQRNPQVHGYENIKIHIPLTDCKRMKFKSRGKKTTLCLHVLTTEIPNIKPYCTRKPLM